MTNYEIIQEVNKGLPELLNTLPILEVVNKAMKRAIELTRSDDVEKACEWLNGNLVDTETFDKEWFVGRFKEAMEEAK